jgi:CRP/FNR family transcriptional regulator, cyclic AMP receptor protein
MRPALLQKMRSGNIRDKRMTLKTGTGRNMAAPASVSTLLLRNVPLFAVLTESQLEVLTSVVSRKSFPRGTTIIAAGDMTDSLYVIISGRLKVMMSDDDGGEVILAILGPNEFFGEMGLLDDAPRSASVVAIEPCELLSLSKQNFKKCMAENFEMTMTVMRGIVKRLREADKKIGSLALMDVYGRVARLLMEMSETIDGQKVVTKKLAKQDIAKMIGASREMVSRVMKDLQTGGFIEVRGGSIFLKDNILSVD